MTAAPYLYADRRGSGPAVVLLHGQPGSAADWSSVSDLMTEHRCVLVPDRPGYGRTGGDAVGFTANAAGVVALLDRYQIADAVVVGHSWGGGVALALAELWPGRVAGLVLVASVSPIDAISHLDLLMALPPGSTVTALSLALIARALSLPSVRHGVLRFHPGAGDERLTVMAQGWRKGRVWRSFVTEQRALVRELPALGPALGSIRLPTLVVTGTADRVIPPATSNRLAEAVPGARLAEIAGAGHLLPQDHPAELARLILGL